MGSGLFKQQALPEIGRGPSESPSVGAPSLESASLSLPREIGKSVRSLLMGEKNEVAAPDTTTLPGPPMMKSAVYAEGGSIPAVEKVVNSAPRLEVPQMRSEIPAPGLEAGPRNEVPRMREGVRPEMVEGGSRAVSDGIPHFEARRELGESRAELDRALRIPEDPLEKRRNMLEKIVEYGERWGSRHELPQLRSSRASLDDFLGKVWDQRERFEQLVAKGVREVGTELYTMYKKSDNPLLRTISTESYLDGLAAIGHRAPPNVSGPDVQDAPQGFNRRFLANGSTTPNSPQEEVFLGGTFYHFKRNEENLITHKVYVRADPNHAIGLIDHVVSNILGDPQKFPGVDGAKVAGPDAVGARCDNLVIYLSDEAAIQRVVDNLNMFRVKYPLAFGSDTPPMSHAVAPGISIAHHDSSGPFKAEAIAVVINDYMGRGSMITRSIFTSHTKPDTYEEFKGRVEVSLRFHGIDPQNPHLSSRTAD